ncbi:hypothetical protein [Acinetobacter proteolyticus]|uniref:Uncharacterized protein n=1 Tax=Acinetobacter proteolyticus TaxID=1776741 RepID=A0A2N0WIC1_9GAMM|nr:hypothetical protein [Acinetobacter proteolyticus]MBK5646240.1 hypothetical protein [Acinetobacter sp.]PKF35511.1 hypothetical protein CW311_04270 [Acinetobacter proteolyticus]
MRNNAIRLIQHYKIDLAKQIIENQPEFVLNEIDQAETMYNRRTQKYIVRGPQSAMIQLEKGSADYFHSTMPYHSSFYTECAQLKELIRLIASHDLIERLGGLHAANTAIDSCNWMEKAYCFKLRHGCIKSDLPRDCCVDIELIKQAIEDWKLIYEISEVMSK